MVRACADGSACGFLGQFNRAQAGKLQLWAVDHLEGHSDDGGGGADAPLQELSLEGGDEITHAAPMQREPFVLLGCRSGAVRVAQMVNASGSGVTAARQVRALKLTAYSSEFGVMDAALQLCIRCARAGAAVGMLSEQGP